MSFDCALVFDSREALFVYEKKKKKKSDGFVVRWIIVNEKSRCEAIVKRELT